VDARRFKAARKHGYRSGLEHKVSQYLDNLYIKYRYEDIKIEWEDLAYRTYTPDFVLSNNIIIETKGMFITADRRKHLFVKRQHPELDIRFVFENSKRKLRKGAKSTYGQWCAKYDFLYYDRIIPESWLKENKKRSVGRFVNFKGTKRKQT
jgi:hypothetical protein